VSQDLKSLTILFRAVGSIEERVKKDVARYGLNPSEFGVLEVLYHKGPMQVQTICEKILIAASSMSYVIDKLKKKGYIEAPQDPTDRRVHIVKLTNIGQELMDDIYPKHVATLRSVFDVLSEEEEVMMQELLKRIGKAH
jgi:MarR family 2-MHQ and catechol resistance regulon transcriptional repressor